MDDTLKEEAILAARAFAASRGLAFEELVTVQEIGATLYDVTFAVEGASDPNMVIDPPEFIIQVNLEKNEVVLIPSM